MLTHPRDIVCVYIVGKLALSLLNSIDYSCKSKNTVGPSLLKRGYFKNFYIAPRTEEAMRAKFSAISVLLYIGFNLFPLCLCVCYLYTVHAF